MAINPESTGSAQGIAGGLEQPRAISQDEAAEIAGQVHDLINEGRTQSAWELIRHLHPADMGSIVAGLPRASRGALVRVMSPQTVAWMLRQMNPVEAGRVGTRIGSRLLTSVIDQVHPDQALAILRRLPIRRVQRGRRITG